MREINFNSIGIIHSPFRELIGMPIQPPEAVDVEGTVEVFSEYSEGLKDIEGFSHIILIYHFHLSKELSLLVKPFLDNHIHGVFATRTPSRPNPIGLSIVNLDKVENNILYVRNLDIVDGTPLLDIKPCVPEFDYRNVSRIGWLENSIHKFPRSKGKGL